MQQITNSVEVATNALAAAGKGLGGTVFDGPDVAVIICFILGMIGTVWYSMRKKNESGKDYFLSGRDANWLQIGSSIFSSNIGSEHLVGLAGAHILRDHVPDVVSVGCPHCSLKELSTLAQLLEERKVRREFWVCCSREVKRQSDEAGYSGIIEGSGAKFATDTCMVVAPVEDLGFKVVATNSAKACHYLRNAGLRTRFMPMEECVEEATRRR